MSATVTQAQAGDQSCSLLLLFLLQAMFSTDLIESKQERVAINGVEPQMIGMLVSYAYTSEVYISKANVQVKSTPSPSSTASHILSVCVCVLTKI